MENGKWVHMMDSAHTGFRNWDDNDWTYPQIRMVNPIPRITLSVLEYFLFFIFSIFSPSFL